MGEFGIWRFSGLSCVWIEQLSGPLYRIQSQAIDKFSKAQIESMWPLPRTFSLACHRIVLSANLVGRTRVALAALYGCGASAMPQALPGNSSSPSVMVNVSSRSWPFSGNLRKFTLLIMYESKVEEIALRKHTCVKEMYPKSSYHQTPSTNKTMHKNSSCE